MLVVLTGHRISLKWSGKKRMFYVWDSDDCSIEYVSNKQIGKAYKGGVEFANIFKSGKGYYADIVDANYMVMDNEFCKVVKYSVEGEVAPFLLFLLNNDYYFIVKWFTLPAVGSEDGFKRRVDNVIPVCENGAWRLLWTTVHYGEIGLLDESEIEGLIFRKSNAKGEFLRRLYIDGRINKAKRM